MTSKLRSTMKHLGLFALVILAALFKRASRDDSELLG